MEQRSSSDQVLLDVSHFPKAAEFIHAVLSQKYRIIIYGGAIRGGKSYNSVGALVLLHKLFPFSRSIIVRDNLQTLKLSTYPTCEKVVPANFVAKFKADEYHWTFKNGSQMFFFGENIYQDPNLDRWNGLEVNFILLEQIEELTKSCFEKALERVGSYFIPKHRGKQPEPVILITVNPTDTWARKEIYDKWIDGTLPEDWLYIPAYITDNPHIEPSFRQSLEQLKIVNPIKYERFVKGDWDAIEKSGNDFYSAFQQYKHVKPVKYDENLPIHLSFDFNVLPYMTLICAQIESVIHDQGTDKQKERLHIRFFKEYCLKEPLNSVKGVCQAVIDDYLTHTNIDIFYYGDSTGKNRIAGKGNDYAFRDAEVMLSGWINHSSDKVLSRNISVFKRRDYINELLNGDDIVIEIDPSCTELIKDMEKVKLSVDGKLKKRVTDKKTGVSWEELGHTSDAFDYLISGLFEDQILGKWY